MFKSATRLKSYVTQKSIGNDATRCRCEKAWPITASLGTRNLCGICHCGSARSETRDRVDARLPAEYLSLSLSFPRFFHQHPRHGGRTRHAYPRKWKSEIISHRIVLANASFCLRSTCYLITAGSPCTTRWLAHFGEIRTTDMSTRWKSLLRERSPPWRNSDRREREKERVNGQKKSCS